MHLFIYQFYLFLFSCLHGNNSQVKISLIYYLRFMQLNYFYYPSFTSNTLTQGSYSCTVLRILSKIVSKSDESLLRMISQKQYVILFRNFSYILTEITKFFEYKKLFSIIQQQIVQHAQNSLFKYTKKTQILNNLILY